MEFKLRYVDLDRLNSVTKYPSIRTYHEMGDKGVLQDKFIQLRGNVIGTEKVDGTNARIVICPDGSYVIGSREELLYAKADVIQNTKLSIVPTLKELAAEATDKLWNFDSVTVLFLEVYGGNITKGSKQYTKTRALGARLFDMIYYDLDSYFKYANMSGDMWAGMRERGKQPFVTEEELLKIANQIDIPVTPRLFDMPGKSFPTMIPDTLALLMKHLPESKVTLDAEAGGRAEGIVVRSAKRTQIVKIRFQDYERTMKVRFGLGV